ncbi:MAG TPA: hypothetical protein EYQ40_07730, partial [Candidatus Marinimicrobia bacterium]|nr:hypothetical protein [Candidatus Neomarinimicrobiota bacterium]
GGSVYIYESNPVFKKVIFKQNIDEVDTWTGGGAVYIDYKAEPRFYQCVFDGNIMDRTNSTNNTNANGGAVGLNRTSSNDKSFVLFDGCTFKNNIAKGSGMARGGALYVYESQAKILNSLFYNNTAYADVGGQNNSGAYGSAIAVSGVSYQTGQQNTGGDVHIINSTIANNKVKSGSSSHQTSDDYAMAVFLESWDRSEDLWFFNNIVWGNQSENGKLDRQVIIWNEQGWSSRYLNYNVIQNSAELTQYSSSFETDPTFADSVNGDYSLANSSSLIGKGGSSFKTVDAPTTDLLGVARPSPSGSNPDIGAYENGLATTPYPAAVMNLTAIGGSGSVTLKWNTVADADSAYKVYKRDGEAFSVAAAYYLGATSAKTVPHDTTYTITGLDNATRYFFRISAVNKQGYEGTSASIDITPTYSGPVWWVSTTGNDDTGDGGTGKPFKTLEHAIKHVTAGDTVKLKKGTHTGVGNYGIAITTNSNSAVIDFENLKNVVITSEEGAAVTIIHANDQDRHFTISGNQTNTIDSTFQFIGLTFTGGKRSDYGGSVAILGEAYPNPNNSQQRLTSHMQPKFKDCVFKDNQVMSNNGGRGGAIYLENAAPIFESCVFDSNYANGAGGALDVGGGNNVYRDTVWVYKSTFKNNWVDDDGMSNKISTNGGAINLRHGMLIIITNSTFEKNMVISKNSDFGSYGGAISINRDWDTKNRPLLHISNSRFTKNINRTEFGWNAQGGAIYAGAPFALYNTVIDSNTAESTAQNGRGVGGGLFVDIGAYWDNNGTQIQGNFYLINNTIADNYVSGQGNNESGESGGVYINHGNEVSGTWFNNIFWGNRSDNTETSRHNLSMHEANTFLIAADYNNVEFSEHYSYIMGSNSYDLNPAFYSATNYQLSGGSPLIGAGVSGFNGVTGPTTDILGNARPNPSGSSPDLGAYENAL